MLLATGSAEDSAVALESFGQAQRSDHACDQVAWLHRRKLPWVSDDQEASTSVDYCSRERHNAQSGRQADPAPNKLQVRRLFARAVTTDRPRFGTNPHIDIAWRRFRSARCARLQVCAGQSARTQISDLRLAIGTWAHRVVSRRTSAEEHPAPTRRTDGCARQVRPAAPQ